MTNYEIEAVEALQAMQEHAEADRLEFVTEETMLLALAQREVGARLLAKNGVAVEYLIDSLESYIEDFIPVVAKGKSGVANPTAGFVRVCAVAETLAHHAGRKVTIVDLLNGIMEGNSHAAHFLAEIKTKAKAKADAEGKPEVAAGVEEGPDATGMGELEQFVTNMSAKAEELDPMIGRSGELERMVQTLCRRRKNNPLLVGEPGVGKTALAEGLAKAIHEGTVPNVLKKTTVYTLDVGNMLAGTKYRGDFEERLKKVVAFFEKTPDTVLFIDEVHTLIGAGAGGGGSLDAANMLKPALSRGKLRCIGATTFEEYRKHFEKDHAMARRFQKIDVNEPTVAETVLILKGLRERFETHHMVKYTDEALEAAAELSAKYINDRFLPDKAIDLIDEAGAATKIRPVEVIGKAEVEAVVAKVAKIPPATVSSDDRSALKALEPTLKTVVFGQDPAIDVLVKAIKMSRSGIGQVDKPIGSFLFAGPTGVGKTEVAKQLAATLGVDLIRFDMSEYMEKHSVSRLIGAPPGYVGYDQGGLLTEAVLKKPHCVVLLDEIEKAHQDVYNILLQVMDYGSLTDNNGRKADFRNVVVIMTTNAGAAKAQRNGLGFTPAEDTGAAEVKLEFSPEFRNRLDAIVTFKPLDKTVILKVVDKFLGSLSTQLKAKNVTAVFTEALKSHLADKGFDPLMGARPMQRLIQDTIRSALADELLFGKLASGGEVTVDYDSKVVISC